MNTSSTTPSGKSGERASSRRRRRSRTDGSTLRELKAGSQIVATVYFALIALLLGWAVWLLVTDDPDGGRHPAGTVMLVVAVLLGVLGLVSLRRSRRD